MMDDDEKTPEELFEIIRDCCGQLGWSLAIDESDTAISGVIIGKQSYVAEVVDQLDTFENYTVYALPTSDPDKGLH